MIIFDELKMMAKRYMLAVAILFAGGCVYLTSRSETLLMFVWVEHLGLGMLIDALRVNVEGNIVFSQDWVRFSLPNALWLLAGLMVFDSIWGDKQTIDKVFWMLTFWGVAMGSEFAQALHLLPGTFDWQDVILMGFVTLFWIILIHSNRKEGTCI